MDGRKKAAARPAPAAEAKRQPAARAALETPSLADDDDAAAQAKQVDDGQPDVASVDESHGAEVEEDSRGDDEDDEQVERFYALLANIRAMRGLALPLNMASSSSSYGGGRGENDDTHTDTETQPAGAGDSARTKRLRPRSAEPPPWRPVFTMEDFEEPAPPPPPPSSCNIRKRTRDAAAGPQRR